VIEASEALRLLQEGNGRFVAGASQLMGIGTARRQELVGGQEPFAVVLGCSDSRVPVELVFDRGPGDLFVIRVAGNVVAPSLIGSVEFAAEACGTRLVIVLGHSDCGAVGATVDELVQGGGIGSPNLQSIVDRIRPAVQELVTADAGGDRDALLSRAVRANVRASADRLRRGSEILERLIASDGLRVVGAEYSLESGVVDFFDGVEPD
jgi:carbonic anhydrase